MYNLNLNNQNYALDFEQQKVNVLMRGGVFDNVNDVNRQKNDFLNQMKLTVNRNLVDDTFSLYTSSAKNNVINDVVEFSANNKVTVSAMPTNDFPDSVKANHDMLHDEKFTNSTSWVESHIERGGNRRLINSIIAQPRFEAMRQDFRIEEGHALKITIPVRMKVSVRDFQTGNAVLQPSNFNQVQWENESIIIVPRSLEQGIHNIDLADVYVSDETNSFNLTDAGRHFAFNKPFKYESMTSKESMNAFLAYDPQDIYEVPNVSDNTPNSYQLNHVYHVGKIKSQEWFSHNYEKNTLDHGMAPLALQGEMVPFDFKGDMIQRMQLGFIGALKDTTVGFVHHYDSKFLDPYSGVVRLEIRNQQASDIVDESRYNSLNGEQLKKFREALEISKFIPIQGIRRFSNENMS